MFSIVSIEIISFAVVDEAALETETRITPLINEKKRLFNDLLTLKGTVLSSVLPDLHATHLCGLSLSWH
jgi:hypothetical protein